jgi:sugar phosphate isomerase/epimerase
MATLSRRDFLRSTAAASAAATLPALSEAGDPKRQDPFGGFTVGLQSYTLRHFKQLDQVLQRIRDLGLRYAEFYREHVPITSTEAQIKAVRNLCREHNITPIAFGVERFTRDHDANRRIFEFARNLGVRYLSADPDPDSFDSLDKLVGEFNISIAIHPHGPVNAKELHRWYSAERILEAVRNHDRRIGTCLDTGHLIRSAQPPFNEKLDPAAQIRLMGARNFGLHLKDHDNQARRDVVYGKGNLDVLSVLRALREVKFQGYISIEYEANPENPMADLRACLDVFRDCVRKLA